jgi:predicted RNA-binding Zn-ribbon protein involved in translation (DUF1610 family)
MSSHARIITIPRPELEKMQEFLDGKGDGTLNTVETYTVKFGDHGMGDIQIDVKVCDGDTPFVDVVMFQDGSEVSCADPSDTLAGKYTFVLKDTYIVLVGDSFPGTVCEDCGNTEFYGHQKCRMNVVVDGDNNWLRNSPEDQSACYDSESPYGPFTCTQCGKEIEELARYT